MHIAVSGSHGLVGSALLPRLQNAGQKVTRIVRGSAAEDEISWNPTEGRFEPSALQGVDAAVHLAGENIASGRWTAEKKRRIRASRVDGTRLVCEAIASLETPPKTLVSASAVGFYGDRGDALLDESAVPGSGFLADVARDWEAATEPAAAAGIRVVLLRFGVILSAQGGALAAMLRPFRLGVGGVVGSGRQFMSWVAIEDVARAIEFALDHTLADESLCGPVSVVAPNPVTNREFTKTLGRVLSRPTVVPLPAFAARLALGEMADELLLSSIRAEPKKLIESGFSFRYSELEPALRSLLAK